MSQLSEKYKAAAAEVRQLVNATVEWDIDAYSNNEDMYTVFVWTAEDHEKGTNRQIYDRKDSPADRDEYGPTTTSVWVVLNPEGEEVTAPTLAEAVRAGIAKGWLPGL